MDKRTKKGTKKGTKKKKGTPLSVVAKRANDCTNFVVLALLFVASLVVFFPRD